MSAEAARIPGSPAVQRIGACDWPALTRHIDAHGHAVVEGLLPPGECAALAALYDNQSLHRRIVVMSRHGFGQGEYRYFAYPLPDPVGTLRTSFYAPLAEIANRWHEALDLPQRFPLTHAEYLARCHAAGQRRPTPLLLRYGVDDYNCLHQDLYGVQVFPLQVAILLSQPGRGFTGGEFVMTEQRPRKQSRATVVPLGQGDAVVFAVNQRPVTGARGVHCVRMRHGVSRVRTGQRHTLGLIFHDAN